MALSLDGTTGVSASGNVTGGNVLTGGLISATGNITGNYILGNGALLTGVITSVANINNGTSNVTVVSSGGNVTVGVAGTSNVVVVDAFGTYITGNLSVSGNATLSGNILGDRVQNGTTSIDIQVASGNANITVAGTSNVVVWDTTGEYVTGLISATGNITGGNVLGGANVNATTHTGTTVSVTGNITGGNVTTAGVLTVNSGSAVTAIVNGGSNAVGNIGSATVYFNRIFAQATTALYADLAEMYTADAQYPAGTVVVFGGDQEITISTVSHDSRVAGVVSTNPAHIMNSGITGNCSIAVALTGRVPCQVIGTISKGDQVVSSNIAGVAERLDISQYQPGVVIGKSLEDHSGLGVGLIEIVVGRV